MTTENLMEEEGKSRDLLHLKPQCFASFRALERIWEVERKEEDSLCWFGVEPLKLRGFLYFYEIGEDEGRGKKGRGSYPGSRHFFFECAENARFLGLLDDWRG